MQVMIRKWGNSASVRLPAAIMQAAGVRLDQNVDVREEDGRIVIEPVRAPRFERDTLIAGITDANRHDAVETGPALGAEIW